MVNDTISCDLSVSRQYFGYTLLKGLWRCDCRVGKSELSVYVSKDWCESNFTPNGITIYTSNGPRPGGFSSDQAKFSLYRNVGNTRSWHLFKSHALSRQNNPLINGLYLSPECFPDGFYANISIGLNNDGGVIYG